MRIQQNPVLIAEEGMALTNGETYARMVYVGARDSVDNWHEVPQAEMDAWLEEQEKSIAAEQGESEKEIL